MCRQYTSTLSHQLYDSNKCFFCAAGGFDANPNCPSDYVDIDLFSLQLDHRSATTSNINEIEFTDYKMKALQLDSKYAVVIDMIFFYGWTHEQTAHILNLPLGTVKTRARKGLSMLKILYQQESKE